MATSKGGYVSGGFDILKAPNAPTITSVATDIGSATVAFTAPTDVGGGAITSYTITAVDESTGASTGAVGTASPITISPGGGTFKIRAAATNIYGPGRVSQYETGKQIYSGAELEVWGNNASGELGLGNSGSYTQRSSPVQVGALTNWSQVSAGTQGTVAITASGTLFSWGSNGLGGVGDNTIISRSSPVQIGALTNWSRASSGENTVGCIKSDGTLWMWGFNSSGQLGQNNRVYRSSPVQVGSLGNWRQVSASPGAHTAAVKTDGTLWGWGANGDGRVGDNTIISRSSPVQIGALTDWYLVSAGSNFSICTKINGTLWSWGRNAGGQLGLNDRVDRSSPVQVGILTNWSQAAAGEFHCAAVKTDGTLWAWGPNNGGALGQNNIFYRSSPVQVGALTNWAQVSSGNGTTMSVKTDKTLWAWGYNSNGQLGVNSTISRSSPVQVGTLTSWAQVSAGRNFAAALYGVV